MVRGKGGLATPGTEEFRKEASVLASKQTLSQTELAGLEDQKKELEATIRESEDGDRAKGADVSELRRQVSRIDHAIETRMPEEARGKSKDALVREEREIEDRLIVGMPTRYEMENPHKCPGAVRKHMAWDARNTKLIRRYVEIQRILRPEEPKSIEELRSEGGPRK